MSLVDDRTIATGEARGKIRLTLNGRQVEADPDPNRSLLSVLREDFGCISLKNGCEPQASCGC